MAEGGYNIQARNNYPDRMQQSQQGASGSEEELASRTLHIQSKRFYLDVKQNRRGRFIKIAEVSAGGRKSRILMSMNVASELSDQLKSFNEDVRSLDEQNPNVDDKQPTEDNRLRSAVITRDDRKYYLDLKENERGKFLRISMVGINNPRTQIAVPAQGIQELRDTLNNLLDEFGNEEDKESVESLPEIDPDKLPENKYLHVGNKNFYFDVGSNQRGVFLRISEVRGNFRNSITIPEKSWPRFRDNIDEFIHAMEKERNNFTSEENKSRLNSGNDDKASAPQSSSAANKK